MNHYTTGKQKNNKTTGCKVHIQIIPDKLLCYKGSPGNRYVQCFKKKKVC